MKLKVGDIFMVTGPAHFEKAVVEKAEKGVYTLNNGLKIDNSLQVIGQSRFNVKEFNQGEYDYQLALNQIPRLLEVIKSNYKSLPSDNLIKAKEKLERIINKYMCYVR